jgi:hypothetical protein
MMIEVRKVLKLNGNHEIDQAVATDFDISFYKQFQWALYVVHKNASASPVLCCTQIQFEL